MNRDLDYFGNRMSDVLKATYKFKRNLTGKPKLDASKFLPLL